MISRIQRFGVDFFRVALIILAMAAAGTLRAQFEDLDTGPALPEANMDGLDEFNESRPEKVDANTAEMELKELLAPGSKEAAEMKAYKKKNAIFQILHGIHLMRAKAYYWDARCQAAADLGEFAADDKSIRDLLFEYGVSQYWTENPHFIPAATASFMKGGTNELPRLFFYLTNSPSWMVRTRMANILDSHRQLAPEVIQKELLNMLVNDPSEDIRGPRTQATFGPYGTGPMPDHLEQLARSRLREEENTYAKYYLLWYRYYKMDIVKKDTGNLGLFRDLMFTGKYWENRWMGVEAIRMGRQERDPAAFPEYERDALPDLIKVLRQDSNSRMRFGVVEALYSFTNSAAALALADAMQKDTDPDIRAYAGRMLGVKLNKVNKYPWMVRYPQTAQTFLEQKNATAQDASVLNRVTAAFGRALADSDPFVRYYAVMGLGKMNNPAALVLLKAFKPDPEDWINDEVAKWVRQGDKPDDTLFLGSGVGF